SGFSDGSILYRENPATPGIVGKLKAKLTGAALPDPYVPVTSEYACTLALEGGQVMIKTEAGQIVKLRALHHCVDGKLTQVLAGPDDLRKIPLAGVTAETVWVEKQGVQRVPMTVGDLWTEVKALNLAVFIPWLLFATFIKFLGILANIVRWKVLLAGQ